MSEEGQKNQDKVDFDSANIGKKEKATQFTVIEGAEERAKEAERAKAAKEKAEEELHQANVEAVADRQVSVEKQEKLANSGVLYKIFAGWHKWAIIGALLLIGGCIAAFVLFSHKTNQLPAKEAAKALYDEQVASIDENNFSETYIAAHDVFQKAWYEASEEEKFWYGYYYALFLRDVGYSEEEAVDVLREVQVPENLTAEEKCLVYDIWIKFRAYEDLNLMLDDEEFWSCE